MKLRILHLITRSEYGGAQSVVAGLAAELVNAGHSVAIASGVEGGGEAWHGIDSSIELFEVGGLGRSVSPLADLEAFLSIRRLYRQWKPDIVHVHTSKAAALGRIAGRMEGCGIVYTMHGYGQLRREHRAFLPIDKFLSRMTSQVIAVSRGDLLAMRSDGYRPIYIANGVPNVQFAAPGDSDTIRRLRSFRANGKPLALLIAREAKPKRIDIARSASSLLGGQASIAWIGGNSKQSDPDNFHALGLQPSAASYLAYADVVLLPSDHEGMPMSVLEGFSAGVPAIVSAVEGCLESVGLNEEGVSERGIAVANNAEAFADAILYLGADRERRVQMGISARAAWEKDYSLATMSCAYLRLYDRLAR